MPHFVVSQRDTVECVRLQLEELEALRAIYPEEGEFQVLSNSVYNNLQDIVRVRGLPANMEFSNVSFSFIIGLIFTICSKAACLCEILILQPYVQKIRKVSFSRFSNDTFTN